MVLEMFVGFPSAVYPHRNGWSPIGGDVGVGTHGGIYWVGEGVLVVPELGGLDGTGDGVGVDCCGGISSVISSITSVISVSSGSSITT